MPPNYLNPQDYPGSRREESRGIRVSGSDDPGHSTPRRDGPLGHILDNVYLRGTPAGPVRPPGQPLPPGEFCNLTPNSGHNGSFLDTIHQRRFSGTRAPRAHPAAQPPVAYSAYPQQLFPPVAPTAPAAPQWQFRAAEVKPPLFSGRDEDYPDFKAAFKNMVDSYPGNIRLQILRECLDTDSREFIQYLDGQKLESYDGAWRALDVKCGSGTPVEYIYTSKLSRLLRGPAVADLGGLTHVFNTINLARERGGNDIGILLIGISNILFGKSRDRVEKLMVSGQFSTEGVLEAILEHMNLLKVRNQTMEQSKGFQSRFPLNPEAEVYQASGAQGYTSSNTSTSGYSGSKPPSQRFSRSPSPGSAQRFGRSLSPGSTQGSARPPSTGSAQRSARSPSPGGSTRSQSPSRSQAFKCLFCKTNDHTHVTCQKLAPKEQFEFCRTNRLCFVCKSWGHGSMACSVSHLLGCGKCPNKMPHAGIFCDLMK